MGQIDTGAATSGAPEIFAGGLDNRGRPTAGFNDAGIVYRRTGGREELDVVGHTTPTGSMS